MLLDDAVRKMYVPLVKKDQDKLLISIERHTRSWLNILRAVRNKHIMKLDAEMVDNPVYLQRERVTNDYHEILDEVMASRGLILKHFGERYEKRTAELEKLEKEIADAGGPHEWRELQKKKRKLKDAGLPVD